MYLHIYNALSEYKKLRPARFHMPGHKSARIFKKLFPQAGADVTELDFSDNLDSPNGVIEKAERDLADITGAVKTFILTDGSSCGIYAMLKAVKPFGSKIIICRNSHRSVYNACEILGIEPIVLSHNFKHNVMLPPSHEEIDNLLKKDPDIIGALITTPDYYGNVANLSKIYSAVKSNERLFLIDGAHGAHLKHSENGEYYAGNVADMWVDGLHKTLPCLTQGSLLCTSQVGLIRPLEEALSYFRTSSPSYPIMASAEYSVKYMAESGKEALSMLFFAVAEFKKRLSHKGYNFYNSEDFLKLAVDFKETRISPFRAVEYLEKCGIYSEFCDGRHIMFYLSPMTAKSELSRLERALKKITRIKQFKNSYQTVPALKTGKKSFSYLVACEMEKVLCPIEKSEGKICAKNAGLFPPCVPIVVAGEIITAEIIQILRNSSNVYGTSGGSIYVVK